ncbi:ABC transporter substrate-binding protein [Aquitalea aquatilis]|uniref:ABC transporter substrate-binding protein n=1 Tax=Aquitalea aquatilis TaxID=1537400 RepID=UPI0010BDDD4F|nr:ABC transporter substrate-binding protein [Aquitalea aquatilis]
MLSIYHRRVLASLLALCSLPALARDLVVVSYGGTNKDAQVTAYYQPFQQETSLRVIPSTWNGEAAKIKAMVDSRNVSWDVVEVDATLQGRGCDEGLFERLDSKLFGNKADFLPETMQPCAMGMFISSTLLAYNADKLKTAPRHWQDFWDTKRFPGKRAMRRGAQYTLEIALMADGVSPDKVYQTLSSAAGVERAFKKLDQIKPFIQWWEAGAQPAQYLLAGDVVMSTAYNGRISNARKEGRNLRAVWLNNIYEMDYWAIPKGSSNKAAALRFISLASRSSQQKRFAEQIAYGPTNNKALTQLSPAALADLPSAPQNQRTALALDYRFWIDHGESLEQRFNSWVGRK